MKLVICGDLVATPMSLKAFEEVDLEAAFSDTLSIWKDADRVLVNLECAMTASENAIPKFGPNLKSPVSTADLLKKAGFTDCMLSNNHSFDFGKEGMADTFAALSRCGIGYTGFGDNYEDSRRDMVIEKDGVRVAIINVCEHEYTYATENRMGARPFDEFETMYDIRKAKANADHVIVVYHGGKEHCQYPSPRLMKACREMVRCGAAAVFCQHSHCIGCYEEFEGGHILYGQGNFHFTKFMDRPGLVATVDITKEVLKVDYTAIMPIETGIRRATTEEAKQIFFDMEQRNATLLDGTWINGWREFCDSMAPMYKRVMAGYTNKRQGHTPEDTPREYQMFAHYLDCEAHTDVWRELYKTWNHTTEVDE